MARNSRGRRNFGVNVSRRISGFRQRWKRWRRGPWPKRVLASSFVLLTFGVGFYLAQLYTDISQLIEEREAALTSAIYSAPAQVRAGDDIDHFRLFDRLAQLSYSETANPQAPGTYHRVSGGLLIHLRAFRVGVTDHPAELVRVSLNDRVVTGVSDAFGMSRRSAILEP